MVSEALLLDHEGPWSEAEYLALPEDRRRIELCSPGPSARQYRLTGDRYRYRYREIVHAEPPERLRLTEPFALDVDLAALAAATRPPRAE